MVVGKSGSMKTMIRSNEPFSPPPRALESVRRIASRIKQCGAPLPGWYDYYARNHAARIAFDLQMVERYVPKGVPIVEFGAVPLLLTGALAESGHAVVGTDLDPERFDAAARTLGIEVVACDVENGRFPFPDGAFGAAVFNEIFEHLRIDLIHTMSEVRRVLAPGGVLLLSTPNGRSYANLANLIVNDRSQAGTLHGAFEALRTVGHMGHVREYTVTEVTEFLDATGFDCEEIIYRGRYASNFRQLVARLCGPLRPFFSIVARARG